MVALSETGQGRRPVLPRAGWAVGLLALAVVLIVLRPVLPGWAIRPPEWLIWPWGVWLQAAFDFVRDDLGLIHVTRGIATGLEVVLDATANLLYGKRRWPYLGPIPWTAFAGLAAVLGYALGGWRLAALSGGTFVWAALMGQWEETMETLSVLIVSVPLACAMGFGLGVAAWRSARVERALAPVLAVFQTLPFFTYLLPAVIFFKVGPTAAAVATMLFALPPMVLMTTVGLRQVNPNVVEAGLMAGARPRQMLFRVYVPAAREAILVGVNQVVMLSLAMVVLTAFIGMPGLGGKLLSLMNSFKLGASLEIGVTIVLIAITLDRLGKAWIARRPSHTARAAPWWVRHRLWFVAAGVFVAFWLLSQVWPFAAEVGRRQDFSMGRELDALVKAGLGNDVVEAITGGIRAFLIVEVLVPLRDTLLWVPTWAVMAAFAAAGWAVGGRRAGLSVAALWAVVALSGYWDRAMVTLYTVLSAVAIAALIAIPAGLFAARSPQASARALLTCDTLQTFPSFIYLIPAIMLFGVSDVAVVMSVVIFAAVPLLRYTVEGLRAAPEQTVEAAAMAGASRWQIMVQVRLPLALPLMAVGLNQAIMFGFFMAIVAAFIGTQDLGQELQRTLAGGDLGLNFLLGACVSAMALSFDVILKGWVARRKAALGMAA